jgi:hypothetical protein
MQPMQIQQPNIVGNFLSAYQTGLERQEAQKEAERQRMRQDRSDQMAEQRFQFDMDDRQLQDAMRRKDLLARSAYAADTPEKWAASVPKVMRDLELQGEPPGFDQRDRIIKESMGIGEQLEQEWKARGYKLDEIRTMAAVRASNANAAQSYAQADFIKSGKGQYQKPLPPGALKFENDMLPKIQAAQNNTDDVKKYSEMIKTGELDPSFLKNEFDRAKTFFGAVDENDVRAIKYNTFMADMKRLREESLRLNTGVQTDKDAERAWDTLFTNMNDKRVVAAQLERIADINMREARQKAALVKNNRKQAMGNNYVEPDWSGLGIDPAVLSTPQTRGTAAPTSTGKPNPAATPRASGWSVNKVGN